MDNKRDNNFRKTLHKLHYSGDFSLIETLMLFPLLVMSFFYEAIIHARIILYRIGILKRLRVNAFVVSVGNLTTGGTGKTPLTCEIANYISTKLGKKSAIISRGYGGRLSNRNTNLISDGKTIFYSPLEAGDEPFWLAKNCPNTAVLTGKNRVKSALYAIENFKSEVLILDDGFQNLRLCRDLDIVLVDGVKGFGKGFLLPAGALREPVKNIKRADKVVIVNKKPYDEAATLKCRELSEEIQSKHNKKTFFCNIYSDKIYDLKNNIQLGAIPGKAFAFTGIAQPEFFLENLVNMGISIVGEKLFADHHLYTKLDIEKIILEAYSLGAATVVTTEKDAVKIMPFLYELDFEAKNIKICALKLRVEFDLKELTGKIQ